MRVFVDSNVFVASLTNEPSRGDVATKFLNRDFEFCTSILNLMEIRSVMTKKKRIEQDEVERVLDDIADRVDIFAPDTTDQIEAYKQQRSTVLYTLDCVLLTLSDDVDATLVTFDSELLDHGGVNPAEFL